MTSVAGPASRAAGLALAIVLVHSGSESQRKRAMTTINTNKPSANVAASNVIPFPDTRTARKQPEKIVSCSCALLLRQALRPVKHIVLCLARHPNRAGVHRKRGPTSALAAQHARRPQTPVLDHRGRAIRERMSA